MPPPSGPAAFRGKIGDCEPRSLSGNHREVHLPTQVQEGEDLWECVCARVCSRGTVYGVQWAFVETVYSCACSVNSLFWDRVGSGLLCSFPTSDVLPAFRKYCSVFYQRLQLWRHWWWGWGRWGWGGGGGGSFLRGFQMYLNEQSNTLPPNTEGVGERHWPTVNPWSLGIYWEKYARNPRIGEK